MYIHVHGHIQIYLCTDCSFIPFVTLWLDLLFSLSYMSSPFPQSHILLFWFSFMPHFFNAVLQHFMNSCTHALFSNSIILHLFSATNSSYCHSAIHPYPHSPILQLADLCFHCTEYFSQGTAGKQEECFLSEASEAYAFGSNSSSQLAMGTQEKVLQATHMPRMANCQVVSM